MTKRSVSLAIHRLRTAEVLLVQRPEDDEELPLVWGLPAASLGPGEGWEEAVRRAGRDKLGVVVEPEGVLRGGVLDRPSYRLEMRLYGARIAAGEPAVPQDVTGVTQYRAWRWGPASELTAAAGRGSLCSRLYLDWSGAGG
ncbi:MAG TPA: NUDIX domain-containing protein [Longimicrobiales bacterium]|nr:NUDIX domain-containing protein [Longimicrobiales bacterium]